MVCYVPEKHTIHKIAPRLLIPQVERKGKKVETSIFFIKEIDTSLRYWDRGHLNPRDKVFSKYTAIRNE